MEIEEAPPLPVERRGIFNSFSVSLSVDLNQLIMCTYIHSSLSEEHLSIEFAADLASQL